MIKVLISTIALFSFISLVSAEETTWMDISNAEKSPENWVTHHGSLDGKRYSGLKEINRKNVNKLKIAFTAPVGGHTPGGAWWTYAGLEGTPVVEDGFMYITEGWGSVIKLDIRNSGKRVWKMDPDTDQDYAGNISCCGINNRGVVLYKDKVISHTIDGRLITTNKQSGEIVSEVQIADLTNMALEVTLMLLI